MSKSNVFGPGANDVVERDVRPLDLVVREAELLRDRVGDGGLEALAGSRVADLPLRRPSSPPPNHGGKAGLSVPTVSSPAWTRLRLAFAQDAPQRCRCVPRPCCSSRRTPRRGSRALPRAGSRRLARTRATLPRRYFAPMRVGRHEVPISNPDKIFFPERGLTKGDLVQYYLDLADCALPHLRRRPFHMERYPERRRRRVLPPEARAGAPGLRRRAVRRSSRAATRPSSR